VSFEGCGIHSGARASVRLSPLRDGRGIWFSLASRLYRREEARTADTDRCTAVRFPGGEKLRTVEHLMSAIAGVGLDDVVIEADGEEIPILDGSALPFAEAIVDRGFEESEGEVRLPGLASPVCVDAGRASIAAFPSEEPRITYVIDYPDACVGVEMKDVEITPENYMREVAPARTFVMRSEIESLRASGLGLGGSERSVMIIGGRSDRPPDYRVERECAAHKVSDLLGDLAVAGCFVSAHYVCICGGHWLHSRLADRIGSMIAIRNR
jgi:UDP-3-O-[3-hydroxymyristoyl] N-acetylglucosamine deacetylase